MTLTIFVACELNENVIPSSHVTTQERIVEHFNGIQVEATIVAEIQYADKEESIVIEANENLHQFIEVCLNHVFSVCVLDIHVFN